jgi:Zn-dependent protease with chaperone function
MHISLYRIYKTYRRGLGQTIACLALTLSCLPPALAQSIREDTESWGRTTRTADNAAKDQNYSGWPTTRDGEKGTQIHLNFDLRNADAILVTSKDQRVADLLSKAQKTAQELQFPQTDFITRDAKGISGVDMEFNDYLKHPKDKTTEFVFPLGALQESLKAQGFPEPIVFFWDNDQADEATLTLPDGTATKIKSDTFWQAKDLPAGTTLTLRSTVDWRSYAFLYFIGGMVIFGMGIITWMPWKLIQAEEKKRREGVVSDKTPNPEEVQASYNKQKPMVLMLLLPLLMTIPIFLVFNPSTMSKAFLLLPRMPSSVPSSFMMLTPFLMFIPMGISRLLAKLYQKHREKRGDFPAPLPPTEEEILGETDTKPLRSGLPLLIMMLPMTFLLPLIRTPEIKQVMSTWPLALRMTAIFGIWGIFALIGGFLALRHWQGKRTTLAPGDEWYDEVHALAQKAEVKVKHVIVNKMPIANAYASLWGTVGLTSKLLRTLEKDEVRAIIAHELGHLKAKHVWKTLGTSLTVLTIWSLARYYGTLALKPHLDPETYRMLSVNPLLTFFFILILSPLLVGRGQRKREEEADAYAVELTNDPELVIRALTKVHTLSASPHTLKPSDEVLQSHPSLKHRIEAIRKRSHFVPSDGV